MASVARASSDRARSTLLRPTEVPWRDRPLTTMQTAAEIAGVSTASLYRFASEGRLTLKRLAGRTLVDTSSLGELIATAETWVPSERSRGATRARVGKANASSRPGRAA